MSPTKHTVGRLSHLCAPNRKTINNYLLLGATLALALLAALVAAPSASASELSAAAGSGDSLEFQLQPQLPVFVNQQQQQATTKELYVAPFQSLKLECKTTCGGSSGDKCRFYWNFKGWRDPAAELIYSREEFFVPNESAQARGYQLHSDADGAYDLMISNVTYEKHDGLYQCLDGNSRLNYKVVVLRK